MFNSAVVNSILVAANCMPTIISLLLSQYVLVKHAESHSKAPPQAMGSFHCSNSQSDSHAVVCIGQPRFQPSGTAQAKQPATLMEYCC